MERGTRFNFATPAEAMRHIAKLWGVALDEHRDPRLPVAEVTFALPRPGQSFDHTARVTAHPDLKFETGRKDMIVIRFDASWPSSQNDEVSIASAAKVIAMAADALAAAHAAVHGVSWNAEEVLGKEATP